MAMELLHQPCRWTVGGKVLVGWNLSDNSGQRDIGFDSIGQGNNCLLSTVLAHINLEPTKRVKRG